MDSTFVNEFQSEDEMSERCSECHGEGERYYDCFGGWSWCRNCGGEGRIDPYEQDEWYEDDDNEWEDYKRWHETRDVTPPSPTGESESHQ